LSVRFHCATSTVFEHVAVIADDGIAKDMNDLPDSLKSVVVVR
jgi:hypothetical protein